MLNIINTTDIVMISIDQINFFKKNGWLKIKSELSESQLNEFSKKVKKIVAIAKKQKYPFIRFYNDYFFSNNVAAIEAPLNHDLSEENLFYYLSRVNLGQNIRRLTSWNKSCCSLIRLFCMENFKYSGHWHRDRDKLDQVIQVSFYLKDEKGFKIRKKHLEIKKDNKYPKNLCLEVNNKVLPFKIDRDEYDIIDAKKGDIIFFEPALLHQGKYDNSRLQFHMRFHESESPDLVKEKLYRYEFLDFEILEHLQFKASLEARKEKLDLYSKRNNTISRIKNLINYFIPYRNVKCYMDQKIKYKAYKFDIYANTIHQKKI